MTRYGMAIDLERCVGCQACATACKIANNLPKNITYNTVYTKTSTDPDDFGRRLCTGPLLTTTHSANSRIACWNSFRCSASIARTLLV